LKLAKDFIKSPTILFTVFEITFIWSFYVFSASNASGQTWNETKYFWENIWNIYEYS